MTGSETGRLSEEAMQRIEDAFVAEFEHSGSPADALDDVFPVVAALVAAAEERGAAKERERIAAEIENEATASAEERRAFLLVADFVRAAS